MDALAEEEPFKLSKSTPRGKEGGQARLIMGLVDDEVRKARSAFREQLGKLTAKQDEIVKGQNDQIESLKQQIATMKLGSMPKKPFATDKPKPKPKKADATKENASSLSNYVSPFVRGLYPNTATKIRGTTPSLRERTGLDPSVPVEDKEKAPSGFMRGLYPETTAQLHKNATAEAKAPATTEGTTTSSSSWTPEAPPKYVPPFQRGLYPETAAKIQQGVTAMEQKDLQAAHEKRVMAMLRDKVMVRFGTYRRAFRNADPDKSGTIDRHEMAQFIHSNNIQISPQDLAVVLDACDPSGRNEITFAGFCNAMHVDAGTYADFKRHSALEAVTGSNLAKVLSDKLEVLFGHGNWDAKTTWIDTNHNGVMDPDELAAALKALQFTPQQRVIVLGIVNDCRATHEGYITTDQFRRALVRARKKYEIALASAEAAQVAPMHTTARQRRQHELLRSIAEKIHFRFGTLRRAFRTADPDKSGSIDRHELASFLRNANMGVAANEVRALQEACDPTGDGQISFAEFCDAMHSDMGTYADFKLGAKYRTAATAAKFNAKLLKKSAKTAMQDLKGDLATKIGDASIRKLFLALDRDRDGFVTRDELKAVLSRRTRTHGTTRTVDPQEIEALLHFCDKNQDGRIEYNEFVAAMRVASDAHVLSVSRIYNPLQEKTKLTRHDGSAWPDAKPSARGAMPQGPFNPHGNRDPGGRPDTAGMKRVLSKIRDKIQTRFGSYRRAFRIADETKDGTIDRGELRAFIVNANIGCTETEIKLLCDACDPSREEEIDFASFCNALHVDAGTYADLKHGAAKRVAALEAKKKAMSGAKLASEVKEDLYEKFGDGNYRGLFLNADKDRDGYITREELRSMLSRRNLEGNDDEVDALLDFMDTNKDGKIEFYEFITAMQAAEEAGAVSTNTRDAFQSASARVQKNDEGGATPPALAVADEQGGDDSMPPTSPPIAVRIAKVPVPELDMEVVSPAASRARGKAPASDPAPKAAAAEDVGDGDATAKMVSFRAPVIVKINAEKTMPAPVPPTPPAAKSGPAPPTLAKSEEDSEAVDDAVAAQATDYLDPSTTLKVGMGYAASRTPREAARLKKTLEAKKLEDATRLHAKLLRLRMRLKQSAYTSSGVVDLAVQFHRADRDMTGLLDFDEFARIVRKKVRATDAELQGAFAVFDDDGTGKIAYKEFSDFIIDGEKASDRQRRDLDSASRAALSARTSGSRSERAAGLSSKAIATRPGTPGGWTSQGPAAGAAADGEAAAEGEAKVSFLRSGGGRTSAGMNVTKSAANEGAEKKKPSPMDDLIRRKEAELAELKAKAGMPGWATNTKGSASETVSTMQSTASESYTTPTSNDYRNVERSHNRRKHLSVKEMKKEWRKMHTSQTRDWALGVSQGSSEGGRAVRQGWVGKFENPTVRNAALAAALKRTQRTDAYVRKVDAVRRGKLALARQKRDKKRLRELAALQSRAEAEAMAAQSEAAAAHRENNAIKYTEWLRRKNAKVALKKSKAKARARGKEARAAARKRPVWGQAPTTKQGKTVSGKKLIDDDAGVEKEEHAGKSKEFLWAQARAKLKKEDQMQQLLKVVQAKIETRFGTFRRAFRVADPDHSGSITGEELKQMLDNQNLNCSDDEVRCLLEACDSSGRGKITFARFCKALSQDAERDHGLLARGAFVNDIDAGFSPALKMKRLLAAARQEIKRSFSSYKMATAFRIVDQDDSGFVSRDELASMLLKMNYRFTQEQIDALMEAADINRDGKISFDEFMKAFGPQKKKAEARRRKRHAQQYNQVPGYAQGVVWYQHYPQTDPKKQWKTTAGSALVNHWAIKRKSSRN